MTASGLLIVGGRVMVPGGDPHLPAVADILVQGDKIAAVGSDLVVPPGVERIEAQGKLVLPGFVNAHYHSHDVLAKGTMEEVPLEIWRLLALPPQYPPRSAEEVYARTLVGALECLRSGMTTVQDMLTLFPFRADHMKAALQAYEDIGLRVIFALQYGDKKGIDTVPYWRESIPEQYWSGLSSAVEPEPGFDLLTHFEDAYLKQPTPDRMIWALGPSAPERCSVGLMARTTELARRYKLPVYSHIYESRGMALQARREYPEHGGSLIRRLQAEDALGPHLNLAHSVWLLPEEIEILGATGTGVVLNPQSNLKLKNGIAPIRALRAAKVPLALGCDNCSCGDAQNMFQAMKLFALLGAVGSQQPAEPLAGVALEAATLGGARSALQQDSLGAIEAGKKADLVLLDLGDPSYLPLNSATRQVVHVEAGRGVETVIVDGRILLRDRRLLSMDEAEIARRIADVMPAFRADFARITARVDTLRPYLDEAQRRIWATDVGTGAGIPF